MEAYCPNCVEPLKRRKTAKGYSHKIFCGTCGYNEHPTDHENIKPAIDLGSRINYLNKNQEWKDNSKTI